MHYFVTGSRAYGPYSECSDLDLVMLKKDADDLFKVVGCLGLDTKIHPTQLAYSDKVWYFYVGDIVVNIISLKSQIDFECWREVTYRMATLPEIKNKLVRVRFFHNLFRDVYDGYPHTIFNPTLSSQQSTDHQAPGQTLYQVFEESDLYEETIDLSDHTGEL